MDEIISRSKELSIYSIKQFLKKLDLDENLLNDIYNIEIVMGSTYDGDALEYDSENNKIIISKEYMIEVGTKIISNPKEDQPIKYLAKEIIHEMLHANRTIDGLGVSEQYVGGSLLDSINDEYKLTDEKKRTTNIRNQWGFEEAINEVIATIIFLGRDKKDLDLEATFERIKTRSTYSAAEKAAAKVTKELGVDMLKWYMTSTRTNSYRNFIKEAYGYKYEDVVKYINALYCTEDYDPGTFGEKK